MVPTADRRLPDKTRCLASGQHKTPTHVFGNGVSPDEESKLRLRESESHIMGPLALDGFRMAQDVVSGQGLRLAPGQRVAD